jgi:hypothetical protein
MSQKRRIELNDLHNKKASSINPLTGNLVAFNFIKRVSDLNMVIYIYIFQIAYRVAL